MGACEIEEKKKTIRNYGTVVQVASCIRGYKLGPLQSNCSKNTATTFFLMHQSAIPISMVHLRNETRITVE